MDIGIINTWLVTFANKGLGIIKNGAIGIEDNRISFVGTSKNFDKNSVDVLIDGSNHITMPGLVNAHIHTGMTLLRGGAQDVPEIEWMNKAIGPIAKYLTQRDIILGSKLGVIEALKSGTTTFAEYASNVSTLVKKVYEPFNVRVVATETINEVSRDRGHMKPSDLYDFTREKGEKAFSRACNLFKDFSKNELVECMFGPQALDMISLDLLKGIHEESIQRNSKMHMHVAQGGRERKQIQGRYGKDTSTVKVLEKENLLDEKLIAAHCHDTSVNERELMVKKECSFVCCPSSISMIDGIVPPVGDFVALKGNIGLGSDQAPGPGLHNMFREMRTISLLTKILKKDPTVLPAWEVLKLGTFGGAKILGLENKIGSLEVGKKADIITIDMTHPNLAPIVSKPFHNFIPNLVYSSSGYEVNDVIINGEPIILAGKFVSIDEQKIIQDSMKSAETIFEKAENDWLMAGSKLVEDVKKGNL